ncbi:Transposase and inactivated derivatives [Streptococcus hyointestinalis]|uniref:Transposase and inactivated derivatives n=1 Tax=Streptococcus hyointestinalis TaxID=1337 RepID=A0A380K1C5_9STRE|nr:Transposase and inactivated derivatives [Streptococcus hyointestinalis]
MSEVHRGRGYVYSIQYHIVWCVKYRYKLLYGQINNKNQGSRLGFFIESYLCFRKVYSFHY